MTTVSAASRPVASRTDGQSPYVTTDEAMAMLGMPRRTVINWLSTGRLRGRKLGDRWRVERASIEEALPPPAPAEAELPALPAPTAVERILALLPELTEAEQRSVAVAALTTAPAAHD